MRWVCLLLLVPIAALAGDAAPKRVRFDVPKVVEETVVPQRLSAIGYPVAVRAVKSRLEPKALVEFFFDQFERAGLYINPEEHTPKPLRDLSITGLDTQSLISYTIIFQANDDETTTAIITETYLGERKPQSEPATLTVLFPGASRVVRAGSEGLQTMSYQADASPDEVTRFYRDVLGKAGFKVGEDGELVRGAERIEVHASPGAAPNTSRVTVLQRFGGG